MLAAAVAVSAFAAGAASSVLLEQSNVARVGGEARGNSSRALLHSQPDPAQQATQLTLERFSDIAFTDHRQQPVQLSDYSNYLVLVNFVFTECSVSCPVQTGALAQVVEQLESNLPVQVLTVSLLPGNDTPDSLARFAARFAVSDPRWRLAVTDPLSTHRLTQAFGVQLSSTPDQPLGHTSTLFLFDRKGDLRQQYRGDRVDQKRLVTEIRLLAGLS